MKAAEWIDRVKTARGWESDYRVSKELGLSRNTISTYRSKGTTLEEDTAVKVAHALDIDPAVILVDQAMERAKNDEASSAWAAVLQRLGGVAATILVTAGIGGGLMAPPDAQAAGRSQIPSSSGAGEYTSY